MSYARKISSSKISKSTRKVWRGRGKLQRPTSIASSIKV
jgi:hypothetical protein